MFEKSQHLLSGYTKEQAIALFYEGRKCKHCGNVLRYKKGYFCVQCVRDNSSKKYANQIAKKLDAVSKSNLDAVKEASKAASELLAKGYFVCQKLHAVMRGKGFDKQVTLAALDAIGAVKEKIGNAYYYKKGSATDASKTQKLVQQVFQDYSAVAPVEHKSPERILLEKLNFISSELISTNHKVLEVLQELRKPNVFKRAYLRVKDWLTK